MATSGPFHIVLPSNSSGELYPNNTVSTFRVKLPYPLSFQGLWECALVEIQYPKTWHNISSKGNSGVVEILGKRIKFEIDEAFYNSPEELCVMLNSSVTTAIRSLSAAFTDVRAYLNAGKERYGGISCQFIVSNQKRKVTVYLKGEVSLELSDELKILLGFHKGNIAPKLDKSRDSRAKMYTVFADKYCDIMQSRYAIYVYCDIIENQIVGHTTVPLLRVVSVDGDYGDMVSQVFTQPHYMALNTSYVSEIEIYLRDDTGDPIPFSRGKSVVTLHFRRRSDY